MIDKPQDTQEVRLDKWLWAARFFKTRSQAAEAVNGGKVHVNGVRSKPSRKVKAGDRLEITRGLEEFEIGILVVSEKRGPAKIAQTLYEESEASVEKRLLRKEERKLVSMHMAPDRRPNKHERRQIRKAKGKAY